MIVYLNPWLQGIKLFVPCKDLRPHQTSYYTDHLRYTLYQLPCSPSELLEHPSSSSTCRYMGNTMRFFDTNASFKYPWWYIPWGCSSNFWYEAVSISIHFCMWVAKTLSWLCIWAGLPQYLFLADMIQLNLKNSNFDFRNSRKFEISLRHTGFRE